MPSQWWTYESEDTVRKRKAAQFERDAKAQRGPNPPTPPPPTPKGPATGPGAASNFERYAKDALLGITAPDEQAGPYALSSGGVKEPKPGRPVWRDERTPVQKITSNLAGGYGEFLGTLGKGLEWGTKELEQAGVKPPEDKLQLGVQPLRLGQTAQQTQERGRQLQAENAPTPPKGEGLDVFKDPEWWQTSLPRTAGSSLPSLVAGLALALTTGGAAVPGALATLARMAGPALASRGLESLSEAGSVYEETQRRGRSEQEAQEAARKVFAGNMALAPADMVQLGLLTKALPGSVKTQMAGKLGKGAQTLLGIGGASASGAVEETAQESLQRYALGDPIEFDPAMQQTAVTGGILSGALQGAAHTPSLVGQYAKTSAQQVARYAPSERGSLLVPGGEPAPKGEAVPTTPSEGAGVPAVRKGPFNEVIGPGEFDATELKGADFKAYRNQYIQSEYKKNNKADVNQFIKAVDKRWPIGDVIQYWPASKVVVREGGNANLYAFGGGTGEFYLIQSKPLAKADVVSRGAPPTESAAPVPPTATGPEAAAAFDQQTEQQLAAMRKGVGQAQPSEAAAIPSESAAVPSQLTREVPTTDLTPPVRSTGELPAAGAGPSPASAMQAAPDDAPKVAAPVSAEPATVRTEAAEAPTRTLPPFTDNELKPLSKYTDTLYREIGGEDAGIYIPTDATRLDLAREEVYLSNSPDLALGQGGNKGILLEFDAGSIQGQISGAKPTWRMLWEQGEGEFIGRYNQQTVYRDALRAVTVKPDAQMPKSAKARLKMALSALEQQGWTKTANPDGSLTYRRPSASEGIPPVAARPEPATPTEPVPVSAANTTKTWADVQDAKATDIREGLSTIGKGIGRAAREADLREAQKKMAKARGRHPDMTDEQAAATPLGQQIARYQKELDEIDAATPVSAAEPAPLQTEPATPTVAAVDETPVTAATTPAAVVPEAPGIYQVSTDSRTGRVRLTFAEAPGDFEQGVLKAAKWRQGADPTQWGMTPRNANERQTALQGVAATFGAPSASVTSTSVTQPRTPRPRTPQPVQPGTTTPVQPTPPTPAQPGAPTPPPPSTTTGGPGGPGSTPQPGARPNPPAPGHLLPSLPSAAQVDARITHDGRIKGLAATLADVPGGKRTVAALDPGLVAIEQYERVYLTFARWEDVAANVRRDAMLQLQSAWEKVRGLSIKDGHIVAGVQPRTRGQSMAWIDVFEHIDDYAASPEIVRFVKLANRLIGEQFAYAKGAGAKLHQRDFGTGHYYGRAVEEVRNVEKRGAHRPDLSRVYDSMEAGIQAGVKYADDPMATFEIVFGALQRREIGARMRSLVAPLGKTTNELVDAGLTLKVEEAKATLDLWGKFAQTMKHVRDGMAPVYGSGPQQGQLRSELQAVADIYPDIGQRLDAARANPDPLVRHNEMAKLATEAAQRAKEAGTEHAKARAARARAVANLQSPEFAAGGLFGRPEPTIRIGRVQTSWAGGRYFPRDVADRLNHDFAARRQDILGQLWGMAGGVSSTMRTMKAGWDLGTMNIQLLPALAVSPKSWAKGMYGMVRYATSPKGYAEYLTAKLRNPKIMDLLERGLSIEGIEYSEALQRGGVLQRGARLTGEQVGGFLEKQVLRRAEMAFEAPLNITKLEMAEALYDSWKRGGQMDDLAIFLNNLTGTRSSMATGIGSGQRSFEGTLLFFSPRYVRSSLALIADATQGGMKGAAARKALAGLAFVGLMFPLAIRAATGQKIDEEYFDPRSSDFASAEVFGRKVGYGTIYRSLVVLVGQSLKAAQENPEVFLNPRDRRENPLVRWLAGRTSPVTSLIWNTTEGRDFLGEPFTWGSFARQAVTPMWAQDQIDAGTAAEMIGLRAIPLSDAQKRNKLRDQYAMAAYGKPWDDLSISQPQRSKLEREHPDLVAAGKKALESGARRGYDESEFWLQVERDREPLRQQIVALGDDLRAGKRSGNEYREEVSKREADMAKIVANLKRQPQWKEVPITTEERKAKYGDRYREAGTPVDRFLEAYYVAAKITTDPKTQTVDVARLGRLRDLVKTMFDPEVVAEGMAHVKRNRDPEYVQAQAVMDELRKIPRYAYTPTVKESDRVYNLVRQYNAIRGSLKNQYGGRTIPRNFVLGEIERRYGPERVEETYQALKLASRPNPERWEIRQENWELLEKFYSDVLAGEMPDEEPEVLPTELALPGTSLTAPVAAGVR